MTFHMSAEEYCKMSRADELKEKRRRNSKEEENLCKEIVLRIEMYPYKAPGFDMIHIPNEQPRRGGLKGREKQRQDIVCGRIGKKLKDMGRKAGVFDYLVEWKGGYGWIEIKIPSEYKKPHHGLLRSQRKFAKHKAEYGIRTAVCCSYEQVIEVLKGWGALL